MKRQLIDQAAVWNRWHPHPLFLVAIWSEGDQLYTTKISGLMLGELDEAKLERLEGDLIPKYHVQAPWHNNITEVKLPVPASYFLKRTRVLGYNGTTAISEKVRAEVRILEHLRTNPHPNICAYYGCLRDGPYIGGICLKKYVCTLAALIENKVSPDRRPPYNENSIIGGIESGLQHLHSMGLVHNDINPRNVMLDEYGSAIIIDFDSCTQVGRPCRAGTPGWTNFHQVAALQNDDYSFNILEHYIRVNSSDPRVKR